jgi:hypothetical protein
MAGWLADWLAGWLADSKNKKSHTFHKTRKD